MEDNPPPRSSKQPLADSHETASVKMLGDIKTTQTSPAAALHPESSDIKEAPLLMAASLNKQLGPHEHAFPPATLNLQLSQVRDGRRQTAPYIQPMNLSPPAFPSTQSRRGTMFPMLVSRDYVVWSLFNSIFLNCCCLGFFALIYSFRARDRKVMGDVERANALGRKAKNLNTAALVVSTFALLFCVIFLAATLTTHSKAVTQLWKAFMGPLVKKTTAAPASPATSHHPASHV
ncbi:uncharacterized protein LOC128336664 [Hemicordylus capensis]|uniref:uncharacterized protein LOC128336664 n=1 Tax=Hemicordylus capensis TaxID=884348 RepID=UPI002303CB61|nr:uncharacterized protein LOC128336664 [Hemicordylus capensis]